MDNDSKIVSKANKPRISFKSKPFYSKSKSSQDIFNFTVTPSSTNLYFTESYHQNFTAPIIKERLANGYRIVELGSNHVKDALHLIKNHYIKTDPLCNLIGLTSDSDSLQMIDYILVKKIEDCCSFCAIEEGTGKLVGVIIGSLKTKNDQSRIETRIRLEQGKKLFYLLTLNSCLMSKSKIYERLNVENYLRIYVLCVETKHRQQGIGFSLIRNFIDNSKELKISACAGAFISGAALTIGQKLGFEYFGEIFFEDALIPGDEIIFEDINVKKSKLFCMVLYHEIPSKPETPTIQNSTPRSNKQKKKNKRK